MIIVTGANGFIGSALVWDLNKSGINDIVVVDHVGLDQRSHLLTNRKYKKFVYANDIWDFLNLESTQKETTWVLHMGANSSTTETNLQHLWENNTLYTQRLWEWCAKYNVPYIYASSAATYGAGELGFDDTTDSEQLRPLNPYGNSKVAFDRWALRITEKALQPPHWYGLKFFNVYGPQEEHKGSQASLVGRAREQAKQNGLLKLFKSHRSDYEHGRQLRDFIYIKDITRWILELMQKQPTNGIYNMGFGQAKSWIDLGDAVFKALGIPSKYEFIDIPENIREAYQYFTQANMDKWNQAGLSKPKWDLDSGVQDYVVEYLEKGRTQLPD